MSPEIHVGDWVRFYQLGQFTIAEVRYILPRDIDRNRDVQYCTDQGQITREAILEVRSKP